MTFGSTLQSIPLSHTQGTNSNNNNSTTTGDSSASSMAGGGSSSSSSGSTGGGGTGGGENSFSYISRLFPGGVPQSPGLLMASSCESAQVCMDRGGGSKEPVVASCFGHGSLLGFDHFPQASVRPTAGRAGVGWFGWNCCSRSMQYNEPGPRPYMLNTCRGLCPGSQNHLRLHYFHLFCLPCFPAVSPLPLTPTGGGSTFNFGMPMLSPTKSGGRSNKVPRPTPLTLNGAETSQTTGGAGKKKLFGGCMLNVVSPKDC